jgi:transcriptional regulator with XRE-family HTH domain
MGADASDRQSLAAAIAQNIRARRASAGMSQLELGVAAGIDGANICRMESGRYLPSLMSLKKVADALRVPIGSLLDLPPGRRQGRPPEKRTRPK